MDAVFVRRVVASGTVIGTAIVPDDDVADAPFVAVLGIRLDHETGQLVDHIVAFRR